MYFEITYFRAVGIHLSISFGACAFSPLLASALRTASAIRLPFPLPLPRSTSLVHPINVHDAQSRDFRKTVTPSPRLSHFPFPRISSRGSHQINNQDQSQISSRLRLRSFGWSFFSFGFEVEFVYCCLLFLIVDLNFTGFPNSSICI